MDINPQGASSGVQKVQWWVWVAIALVALALLGGLYLYRTGGLNYGSGTAETEGATEESLLKQGTSDELSVIEKDVSRTNLIDLDKELGDIDAQLP
ncbi:MAG: hypothetical protein WAP51_01270 [Candidatus Sungiibacteriota bacterium]